ncbi:MAG TPA: stage II sporulation protein M [Candidatus Dormibacteraeota bacterium]|nr:stage II sporulation protein M [Candidatus Dormibacteraeota bacterium]
MISNRWLAKRKPNWQRLEQLLDRSGRRGVAAMTHDELQDLGLLYRQTASDLATVREDITSLPLASYLNQLLARAHNLIYMGKSPRWSRIAGFYLNTYPRIFRETFSLVVVAALVFAASGVAGAVVTLRDPGFAHQILGPQMIETIEKRQMWTHSILAVKPMAASGIMTNNLAVGFMMFAAGITAGLGTVVMLVTNGLLMGVLAVATARAGMAMQLWEFVAPHGVLELPAIFIAAGAGMELARGLLFPGILSRKESLMRAGNRGAMLLLGTIPLLVVAGVIEAFISPVKILAPLKFLFAAVVFAALVAGLSRGMGKRKPEGSL